MSEFRRKLLMITNEPNNNYFYIQANTNSTVGLNRKSSLLTIQYALNNLTSWSSLSGTISLGAGDIIYLKGTLSGNNTSSNFTQFNITGNVNIGGPISWLWYNNNTPTSTLKNYCGFDLFKGCTAFINADKLIFPDTVSDWCYGEIFHSSNITSANFIFPSTYIKERCYAGAFYNCTNLVSVSKNMLPATTLSGTATGAYNSMFYNTKITVAPDIMLTICPSNGCSSMFMNCSRLTSITCYATNNKSTYNKNFVIWMRNVPSTGNFYIPSGNQSNWVRSEYGIPNNWTIITL